MPLSTRYLSIKAIFRPFPAADGQIGGHMDIILAVLNRIFHGLSFNKSHEWVKSEKNVDRANGTGELVDPG